MKVKIFYIVFVVILLLVSISQMLTIPPYAGSIFHIYKSGYFNELEKSFNIIIDSFLGIKMMSKPVYAWIFLDDVEKKYEIDIKLYNNRGQEIPAPGETESNEDNRVADILNSLEPESHSEVNNGKYFSAIPIFSQKRCGFCHNIDDKKNNILGVITFEREYNSYIYYSSERIIIFILISFVLIVLLYYIIRWEPGGIIKELFDKS